MRGASTGGLNRTCLNSVVADAWRGENRTGTERPRGRTGPKHTCQAAVSPPAQPIRSRYGGRFTVRCLSRTACKSVKPQLGVPMMIRWSSGAGSSAWKRIFIGKRPRLPSEAESFRPPSTRRNASSGRPLGNPDKDLAEWTPLSSISPLRVLAPRLRKTCRTGRSVWGNPACDRRGRRSRGAKASRALSEAA